MHSINTVVNAEALKMVVSANPAFIEFYDGTACQVFRACHAEADKAPEENNINISQHHNKGVAWYYKIQQKMSYTVQDIVESTNYKRDQALGLRGPTYGELIWHETGELTPSITIDLPEIYQIAHRLRRFAHELVEKTSPKQAKTALDILLSEIKKVE